MTRPAIIILLLLIFGVAGPSSANAEWRDNLPDGLRLDGRCFWAGGYSFARPFLNEGPFTEANLRFNGRYNFDPRWKLEFAWQVDGIYYEGISRMSDSGTGGVADLAWMIDEKSNWRASHFFDRLSLNYRADDFTLDIGRQRIAWGTTFSMSFMDMFHPLQPGNPFVPEQAGTDAVRLQVPTGPIAGWDFLYAWFDNHGDEAFAAKYHDVHGDFESAMSAGRIHGGDFAAFQTTGDVNDVGIRLEAAWRDTGDGEPYQLALESDYAPNSSTYLSGEVFYNGPGATGPEGYSLAGLGGGSLYVGRWYAGTSCTYNPGGLSTLSLYGIANLSDDSWFADLAVLHSASDSTDLRIGFQHYEGHILSEYGLLPDIIYFISTTYF